MTFFLFLFLSFIHRLSSILTLSFLFIFLHSFLLFSTLLSPISVQHINLCTYIISNSYEVCNTYPSMVIVPRKISDDVLKKSASFRQHGRFPVLCYFFKTKMVREDCFCLVVLRIHQVHLFGNT